jgi:three-Cys-motif partner protein
MSKKTEHEQFYWRNWTSGQLPGLEHHSAKKLDLLHDYLVLYLEIVLRNAPGKEIQEITLIDGFAGGGLYEEGKTGSPISILTAVKAAEAKVNIGREKKIKISPICFFIEEDPCAFECLKACLTTLGYGSQIGKTIHLRNASFEPCVAEIIHDIKRRHKRGGHRTIFFLDQCGYTQVPAGVIQKIDQQLGGRAEFIINFSITWFGEFLSEKTAKNFSTSIQKLGLENHVNADAMLKERQALGGSWKHAVESHIGSGFHHATGIKFFTPFYIEPVKNHRGYWLLHLAHSSRARQAMTEIHWEKHNGSRHYGPKGYGILSYKPDLDPTEYIEGMAFDDTSRAECQKRLAPDFARLLRDEHDGGITYEALEDLTSNNTIADAALLNDVIWELYQSGDFEVLSPSGRRKTTRNFSGDDRITPRKQMLFNGVDTPTAPTKKR